MPAVETYQVEPPTMASANQGDNYTPAVHKYNHFPPNSVYRPVTPPPSKYRTTLGAVSPILIPVKPIDILDEEGQMPDTRAATPSPFIESTSSDGWPDGIVGSGGINPNLGCIAWPDSIDEQEVTHRTPYLIAEANTPEWIDEQVVTPSTPHLVVAETNTPEWIDKQDVTPSTPHFTVAETNTPEWIDEQDVTPSTSHLAVAETNTPEWIDEQDVTPNTLQPDVAETNAPEWTVDEDVTSLSQYPIPEIATSFHWPEMTFSQEFFGLGVDPIDLWSPNFESRNFDEDDSVLRAFGVSSIEDLDWVLEGFRATSVTDTCIEFKSASNNSEVMFVPPLHNFSPVSPYDWAVSEAGPDLISFDSAYGTFFTIIFTVILLSFPP